MPHGATMWYVAFFLLFIRPNFSVISCWLPVEVSCRCAAASVGSMEKIKKEPDVTSQMQQFKRNKQSSISTQTATASPRFDFRMCQLEKENLKVITYYCCITWEALKAQPVPTRQERGHCPCESKGCRVSCKL